MADFKLKLREAIDKSFSVGTGQKHNFQLILPHVFVLDVEDSHFNHDRSILLPDLTSTDDSAPVLDARRVTGVGVIFAALVHAKKNPAQGLFVSGHTDASGSAAYNQTLSEDRAKNVSLLLRGKRDDWRKQAAKEDAVDDYQTVLKWQHQRAGWDCDPGEIDNKLGPQTKRAIGEFQTRYSEEVTNAKAGSAFFGREALVQPGKKPDQVVGKQTWGAFYDVYMDELMALMELTDIATLEAQQAQFHPPSGMTDFVGCGEHIPHNPARRDPFAKQSDELDGPQKNPVDRRVEILFFDPGEEADLVCHPKPGKCVPADCPVYTKGPHQQVPIGIPKGLPITEVNLRLTFLDPEGKVRPFPEGIPVRAQFGDPAAVPAIPAPNENLAPVLDDDPAAGDADASAAPPDADAEESMEVPQEPTATVEADGILRFAIPRRASSMFLRLLPGADKRFVTADPANLADSLLATQDEAREAVAKGRVFFQLPPELNTAEGYFDLPDAAAGVTFKDGAFRDIDSKQTQIGEREAPVELRLSIHWQHFKFEYFDRWTSSPTTVGQSRPKTEKDPAQPPLVLEGIDQLIETTAAVLRVEARSAWDVPQGKATVHCLAWVRRQLLPDKRDLPDDKCTARFVTQRLFVRTEGDGASPDAPRTFVAFGNADDTPNKPGVDRLRLYDLPGEWRSRVYPSRVEGETPDKARAFEQVAATPSTLAKPFVVSLDVIVLPRLDEKAGADPNDSIDDADLGHRITILDQQMRVHKPDPPSAEPYFTRVADLKPKPVGPVLVDVPPFTRLIARGRFLFDVFDRRTSPLATFAGVPTGARLALRLLDQGTLADSAAALPMSPTAARFQTARANSSNSGPVSLGDSRTVILRCCGRDKNVELFNVVQYINVSFDFSRALTTDLKDEFPLLKSAVAMTVPPPNAKALVRDCLTKIADRWNGRDDLNQNPAAFEIGAPVTARGNYVALVTHGRRDATDPKKVPVGQAHINLIKSGRSFMAGGRAEGFWDLGKMTPEDDGRFTAAHETGHIFGQPDEYLNTDDEPSYGQPNIGEDFRSAGAPYGLDRRAMMVSNYEVRTRYFWDSMLFASERGHFTDAKVISVKRGPRTFSTEVKKLNNSRVRFPVAQKLNASVPPLGLCDLFVYSTGVDEFTAGIDSSAKATPYDGFIMVRVKMNWIVKITTDFDAVEKFMDRAARTIRSTFNADTQLAIRATLGGKQVRLRVLFAPRFIGATFPTPLNDGAKKYLGGVDGLTAPFTKAAYDAQVTKVIGEHGVHVNVTLTSGTPGVKNTSVPREAVVRDDASFLLIFTKTSFDDDVVAMFGQMIGVPTTRSRTVADYKALLATLPSDLTNVVPEIVP